MSFTKSFKTSIKSWISFEKNEYAWLKPHRPKKRNKE